MDPLKSSKADFRGPVKEKSIKGHFLARSDQKLNQINSVFSPSPA